MNLNLFEYTDNIESQTLQQKRFLLEQCEESLLILDIEAGLSNTLTDWWNLCNYLFILCDGTQFPEIQTEGNLLNVLEAALCQNIVENNLLGLNTTPILLFNWCNTPIPPYWNIPVLPRDNSLNAMVYWIQQRSDTFLPDYN